MYVCMYIVMHACMCIQCMYIHVGMIVHCVHVTWS